MCGRFTLTASPEEVARHFELDDAPVLEARWNVAPGQDVATLRRAQTGRRVLELRRWGLVPPWADDPRAGSRLINARAETAAERPAFRRAFRERRCLVPADGFYEWARDSRQPYHVALEGGALFGMAAIWERWRGPSGEVLESCAILTTDANERLRPIHERMPVILAPADYARWLDPDADDPARLADLLRPRPAAEVTLRPVSRRVNDVERDDSGLLEPFVPEPEPTQLGLDL